MSSNPSEEFEGLTAELGGEIETEVEEPTEPNLEDEKENEEDSTIVEEAPEDVETEEIEETEEVDETDATEKQKPQKSAEEDKARTAFIELRKQNKVYKDMIKKAAAAAGQTPDEYMKAQDEKADEAAAKEQNIPVDVYRRMQQLEEKDALREVEHRQAMFQQSVLSFKQNANLSDDELRDFAQRCIDRNIDMEATGVDLETLYKGICYDKIIEKERQGWIKKDSKNRETASTPGTRKGKAVEESKVIETMDDFEGVLEGINTK